MVVPMDNSSPVAASWPCEICHDFQPVQSNPKASPFDQFLNQYNLHLDNLHDDCPRCSLLKAILFRLESLLAADYPELRLNRRSERPSSAIWVAPNSDGTVLARYTWDLKRVDSEDQPNTYMYREVHIYQATMSEIPESLEMKTIHNMHWSPSSEESIQFVKDLLRTCEAGQDDHNNCSSEHSPPLPTRVIRIGPDEGSLSLYESQPGETGSYVALSHCWGPPSRQPIRTTRETISHMRVSVPEAELSCVFGEAIWLCRQLGIQYIWIDSLCIIQDDRGDWEIESAKMAQYYSEAHLTVAAESSTDGTVSFLRESRDRWQRMIFAAPDQAGQTLSFAFQEHFSQEAFTRGALNYWKDGANLLPTRAWTLQESVLSKRIVRFTPSDIIWQCQSTSRHHDSSRVLRIGDRNIRQALFALHHLPASDEDRRNGAYTMWTSLVLMYSQRAITYDRDRLPAFSGIAEFFSPIFQGRYFAGIWETHLPCGLGWTTAQIEDYARPQYALEQWVAPSWSWASLPQTAVVSLPDQLGDDLDPPFRPKILEAFCERSDKAPFGRVRSGYILLEAPLYEVTLTCRASLTRVVQYMVELGPEYEEMKIRKDFREDCLLAVEDGFARRATKESKVDYQEDPSTFRATAWVLWVSENKTSGLCGMVLGLDELAEGFQRVGLLTATDLRADMLLKNPARRQLRLI